MENEKVQNKIVETYGEDMARVIEGDQGGLIKKIIHEQEQKELEKKTLSPDSKRNKTYMLVSALLLLLAFFTFIFFIFNRNINTVPIERQFDPLIFYDKSFFIETASLSKEKIIGSILTEINATNLKNGGLEGIYLTENKQIIGLREFISTLKSSFVPPANNNLVADNFLMGLVNGTDRDFFILIKMRSFQDIFDSVRIWENKMFYDLHSLFGMSINSSTSYLLTKNFDDGIIENKNARILYDKNGEIVMMYVFADETSLVIADNIEAVREVMFRLSSSQLKK